MAFETAGITISQIIDLSLITKNILSSGNIATRTDLDTQTAQLVALTGTVRTKADQTDLDALTTVVGTKAAQTDLDALTVVVGSKADQSDLDALAATVDGKAAQTALDALGTRVTALETPHAYATAMRPDPATFPAGTMIYDTDLTKPLWSDGTIWRDAAGVAA